MPFAGDDINQEHVDIATNHARRLAGTAIGRIAGADELEAHAMVVLWDLALTYDDDRGATFITYLHEFMERRIIDWLRREYGRASGGDYSAKLRHTLNTDSLDALTRDDDGEHYDWLPDTSPGPEQHAIDREQFTNAMRLISKLTAKQRDGLLYMTRGYTTQEAKQEYGSSVATHRQIAKNRLRFELGRTNSNSDQAPSRSVA